jgi:hypothetical protein
MRILPALAAGLLVTAMTTLPALAQRAAPKNASEAIVTNARSVAVTGLEITTTKGDRVGTLKAPLQPGKRISFKFRPRNGCLFTVNAAFADEAEFDQQEVDLCTDKNIRFVD